MDLSKLASRITNVARQKRDSRWEIRPDGELIEANDINEIKGKLSLHILWLSDQDGSSVTVSIFDDREVRRHHTILEVSVLPGESLESRVWVDEAELIRGGAPWL